MSVPVKVLKNKKTERGTHIKNKIEISTSTIETNHLYILSIEYFTEHDFSMKACANQYEMLFMQLMNKS